MENESSTIASEIISEQEDRIKVITLELESIVNDLFEKEKCALTELMDLIDEKPDDIRTACFFADNQYRMNMLVNIAFDYLHQAQVGIGEIVIRERKLK